MVVEMILVEGIVIALITAFATVAAVVITEVFFGRRIYHLLERHDENSSKEINGVCKESTQQHYQLSSEHKDILNKQDNLIKGASDLHTLIGSSSKNISKDIRDINMAMREEKIEQRHRYERLNDHQKVIVDSVSNLTLLASEMEKLNSLNADLASENQRLQQEIQDLSLHYNDLKRDYKDIQTTAKYRIQELEDQLHSKKRPQWDLDMDI